ncbi:MAG: mechanosensitive ion channel [Gammaproteobacteria bacterium]|nr:mechanosensitive ion channel [Gammaproteobacteria bacterium]MCW5582753.1 mechanosensitive ion channel [Gammaproteobacteria bacterium]
MRMRQLINQLLAALLLALLICPIVVSSPAKLGHSVNQTTIDRTDLVTQQINLLKSRLSQGEHEYVELQQQHDKQIAGLTIEKATKNLLDKASLDISVSKSNLDSINIELTDAQHTIAWLEKSTQEIENQLNVLSIFGLKVARNVMANPEELRTDLKYQQNLLALEKKRLGFLQNLQRIASNILTLRTENYNRLHALLKSRNLLHMKQEQAKDELAYQEKQNYWLQQLNVYYAKLAKIDPVNSRVEYAAIERDIYYANENANYAYVQSLIARYADQIQQMKLAVLRSSSISVLNEIGDQFQALNKQIDKLGTVLKSRINVLEKHIAYLSVRKKHESQFQPYIKNLSHLAGEYKEADRGLTRINSSLAEFRQTLDHALKTELSSRQGFPTFGLKTFLDLGKEMLLVPALTFQIIKSLSSSIIKRIESTSLMAWSLFALTESLVIFSSCFLRKLLTRILERPSKWRDKINTKWLSLQWLSRNFIDLFVIANIIGVMRFFGIALQHYIFIVYLSLVWLAFKGIMVVARLCLVETTHDSAGNDMQLYRRLRWIILIGGIITAFTVFVHQLPLIYELKTLCDRLFLLLLMIISLLLLRSYDVVPNLILTHMESHHPYLRKSVRLIGILVPILIFGNAVIGICGFVNLIMTVSWYEGIFLIVLIGYLILRGLLSDGMEQLSRLMIQYVHNGWLWTEAFLKPIDTILRIILFLTAWAVLFLLYGWDKQSPIVERLTRMLHYKLASVLNTTITPLSIIELFVVISIFYWTAKWIREFVYRLLPSRTTDMGMRNSIAILSQYTVIILGAFFCLRVLGIDLRALAFVSGMFAFGVGLGLRDLANNFACGFLILLERPLRVGDIVNVNSIEGEVTHIGSRAVTIRTWDYMELVVPNAEIFNKSFTNWTAKDNIIRSVIHIKISRYDNPHEVRSIIQNVLATHKDVLNDPPPEVFLKEMSDVLIDVEIRYFVNIRQVKSRTSVISTVLASIWDAFAAHGIKPPHPQREIVVRNEMPMLDAHPKVRLENCN